MNNYKLIIQYDGTGYAGWQMQNNASTIQQKITGAVYTLLKENVNLIGSGRTDAGVHALGQAANFRCDQSLDPYRFRYQMNSILPSDISITDIESAEPDFHARFDAKKRSYIYIISGYKTPFLNKYSWYFGRGLEIDKLNRISRMLEGQHDFTSFCKTASETSNKVCTVYGINWKETMGFIIFFIEADRFLHGMVRTIIGTLLKAAESKSPELLIEDVLLKKDRTKAGESVPASGLFLYKVKYGN